jgi:peptidoglycan/LPS O-acetylase OafA/YrhL
MLIRKLDQISEFFLVVLAFGVTLGNAPAEISAYLLIFIFLLKLIIKKDINDLRSVIGILFLSLLAVIFVSALRSSYPDESWRGFSRVPKYAFLFFALTGLFKNNEKRMSRFFWIIIAAAAVTFVNGIFQSISGFDFFKHNAINKLEILKRIMVTFADPNDFGAYIISVPRLPFCF